MSDVHYPTKITRALETLDAARADGDVEAIERAVSDVTDTLVSLDFDDFASDDEAFTVIDAEAASWLSEDATSIEVTIDDEEWTTIRRDDPSSWRFKTPGTRLFVAYEVAFVVKHVQECGHITVDNAWITELPLTILEGERR